LDNSTSVSTKEARTRERGAEAAIAQGEDPAYLAGGL